MKSDEPIVAVEDRLRAVDAQALNEARTWPEFVDAWFGLVCITDELTRDDAGLPGLAPVPIRRHNFGSVALSVRMGWTSIESSVIERRRTG